MLRKISNGFLISFCCIFLVFPDTSLAADKETNEGKIKWDTNRILEDEKDEEADYQESELEEVFPELFEEETQDTMQQIQEENKETMSQLKDSIFSKELKKEESVEGTEKSLFTSDYVAPSSSSEDEQAESNSGLNFVLVLSFIGLGIIILGGIYFMIRKLTDEEEK